MPADKSKPEIPTELIGACRGILADGKVVMEEALFLQDWIARTESYAAIPTIQRLHRRIRTLFEDGSFCSSDARTLYNLLQQLVLDAGQEVHTPSAPSVSSKAPRPPRTKAHGEYRVVPSDQKIFDKPEVIDFAAAFCFTGIFAFGEREQCESETTARGGIIKKFPVGGIPCYVVMGSIASPDWLYGNYGTKIQKAIQYREKGKPVWIIHEDMWANRL